MKRVFHKLQGKEDFAKFLDSIADKFNIPPNPLLSEEEYISSLLLIDLIHTFLSKAKVKLPPSLNVLDAGAGHWPYAVPLYSYFCNGNGLCDVELHGIDVHGKKWQKDIVKQVENHNIHYHIGDIFDLNQRSAYDIVFFIHMFPPYRFREHGIPFRPYRELFAKACDLLKKDGILFAIAYGAPPEEYSFFNEVPSGCILTKGRYTKKEATLIDFILEKDTFHNNMVLIARK